jgi:hypothetical protein
MPYRARATSCLYGIGAIVTLWVVAIFAASAAWAQEPRPQHWDRETANSLLDRRQAQ